MRRPTHRTGSRSGRVIVRFVAGMTALFVSIAAHGCEGQLGQGPPIRVLSGPLQITSDTVRLVVEPPAEASAWNRDLCAWIDPGEEWSIGTRRISEPAPPILVRGERIDLTAQLTTVDKRIFTPQNSGYRGLKNEIAICFSPKDSMMISGVALWSNTPLKVSRVTWWNFGTP